MKNRKHIIERIAISKHRNDVRRRLVKRKNRRRDYEKHLEYLKKMGGKPSMDKILDLSLTDSTKYLFSCPESPFYLNRLQLIADDYSCNIHIPRYFSLVENPDESYNAISKLVASFFFHRNQEIVIDYSDCANFTLEAQVLLDILLKDILKCNNQFLMSKRLKKYYRKIIDRSVTGSDVRKMLFSVGSQAEHANKRKDYSDIIPYNLCIHKTSKDNITQIEQKDIDTTSLSDYVENCLARMGRKLDSDSMDNLCTVIGEILINAEEHSSTNCRYSIGYFEEKEVDDNHIGQFQLVIMNFGRTIYEKFHDEDCPNKSVVSKMQKLSDKYSKNGFWRKKQFEEETLWTLYSLQDGVTSVSPSRYKNRGNGSCHFIESFFNLRNESQERELSRMVLHSGYTDILFDGSYRLGDREVNGDKYRVMTFNKSGDIEDMPDVNYVKSTDYYFPGTYICANIIF